MLKQQRFLLGVALVISSPFVSSPAHETDAQIVGAHRIQPKLLDAMAADSGVLHRIVVGLEPVEGRSELLTRYKSEEGLRRVQDNVRELQEFVLGDRAAGKMRRLRRYTSLYGFSAEADREAIVDLARMPEVRRSSSQAAIACTVLPSPISSASRARPVNARCSMPSCW